MSKISREILDKFHNIVQSKTVIRSGCICSEFIHWVLSRILMRTEYCLFVHHTTSILAKLSTWYFEHSGDISCSVLVNLSHTDESWQRQNTCMWIYIYIYIYIYKEIEKSILHKRMMIYIYIYIYMKIYKALTLTSYLLMS